MATMNEQAPMSRSRRSEWLRRAALLLSTGVLTLLLAELGARYRFAHPAPPPASHRGAPSGMFVADPETGYRFAASYQHPEKPFSTNSMGMRDRAREPGAPPDGTLRVLVVGDSFTAGSEVADGLQFSARLEASLTESSGAQPVEVWNLGTPHFGTEQSLSLLRARWQEVQPQVVVLGFFEGNDPYDDLRGPGFFQMVEGEVAKVGWAPTSGSLHNARRAENNRPRPDVRLPADRWLQAHSYAYRLATRAISALRFRSATSWPGGMAPFDYEAFGGVAWLGLMPEPPAIAAAWEITGELVAELRDEVQARGAEFLVLAIPARFAVEDERAREAARKGWQGAWQEDPSGVKRTWDPQQATRRLAALCEDLQIQRVDLQQELRRMAADEAVYYPHDSHWTPAGHQVAAAELGKALDLIGSPNLPTAASEIFPVLEPASELLTLLPAAPPRWSRGPAEARLGRLPPPLQSVEIAVAEATYTSPSGVAHRLQVIDGAAQPEIDHLRRRSVPGLLLTQVGVGLLPSTARLAVRVEPPSPELEGALDRAALQLMEERRAPPGGRTRVLPTHIIGRLGEGPGVPRSARRHLVNPSSLAAAVSAVPPGWEGLDTVPLYRSHAVPEGISLPPKLERTFAESTQLWRSATRPVTAQIKRWYRGPEGAFALVLQDSGRNERLLRAREARTAKAARTGESSPMNDGDGPTLRSWEGAGYRGYHSCLLEQGLCKVVVALRGADDPRRVTARWNAIIEGPPEASDEAYAALLRILRLEELPR